MRSGSVWPLGASGLATSEVLHGRRGRAGRQGATPERGGGSLMRHAGEVPGAVGPLAVAVVEAAFRALLVAAAGRAETPGAPEGPEVPPLGPHPSTSGVATPSSKPDRSATL